MSEIDIYKHIGQQMISDREKIKELEEELEDYKTRCKKAAERIKQIQFNARKYGADHDAIVCQDLLNILRGDKE